MNMIQMKKTGTVTMMMIKSKAKKITQKMKKIYNIKIRIMVMKKQDIGDDNHN